MFNIGGGEFIVIALIALIVLGPQRLPDAARQVGKAMGELRRLSSGFQNELRDAFADTEAVSPPPATARRDVLHAGPEPAAHGGSALDEAVANVSGTPRRTRRTPLKASPEPTPEAGEGKAASAAAVPKAPRPRTKGS